MLTIEVIEDAFEISTAQFAALEKQLASHPLFPAKTSTDGMLLEVNCLSDFPECLAFINPQLKRWTDLQKNSYLLSVNRTIASPYNEFLMRPHLDRIYKDGKFGERLSNWTSVHFLEFAQDSLGGELIVFDPEFNNDLDNLSRSNGRQMINAIPHQKVLPVVGTSCRFSGQYPHAVLGFENQQPECHRTKCHRAKCHRTTLVFAEFSRDCN